MVFVSMIFGNNQTIFYISNIEDYAIYISNIEDYGSIARGYLELFQGYHNFSMVTVNSSRLPYTFPRLP